MKLIDGDEIKEDFSEILERDYKDDYARGFQAALVAVLKYKAIAAPPNDPLTLEELREMDGEPVWVVGANDRDINRNGYAVVDLCNYGRENAPVIFWFGEAKGDTPKLKNYGKTWYAYLRRPERKNSGRI